MWVLGSERATSQTIRNLRLCLLRLHAEQEVLVAFLGRLASGAIAYCPGKPVGERIDAYVNKATRRIDRSHWGGI